MSRRVPPKGQQGLRSRSDATHVSTGRSGSGADWVFVDGGIVKVSWLGGGSENVGFILE